MESTSVNKQVSPGKSNKRKKLKKGNDKNVYLDNLSKPDDDEFDFYGKCLAVQLRKMNKLQSIFAQNIINQVIFQGKLDKLQENTTVYTPFEFVGIPTPTNSDRQDNSTKPTPKSNNL